MAVLLKLVKGALGAALLSRTTRSALLAGLTGLASWIARPSTQARTMRFFSGLLTGKPGSSAGLSKNIFKGAAELLLLKYAKRVGLSSSGALALSALAALLWAAMKGEQGQQGEHKDRGQGGNRPSDQVIDVDDFTVVDEKYG
ncbi:MAG TPA: hypothetical protein PKK11_02770 [Methanothrix sp.]|nr:hypothetical protein [Methanothrix sp.]HPT19011.1 hypothetical protein [Methanothrix sp.]